MRWTAHIPAFVMLLVACSLESGQAPIASEWHDAVEVASGQAHVGPWRMNESNFRYVDDPTVALAPNGEVAVAWADQARQDIFFRRYDVDGKVLQDAPTRVSGRPDVFSWLPRMVITDNDTIHALWQEIIFSGGSHGGEIHYSRSTDGGASFSDPVNLSRTTNGAGKGRLSQRLWHNGSLDLAAARDGTLYAAWTEYQGPLRLARSEDGGSSWSKAATVFGRDGQPPARGPTLATGPDGHVHLAWAVGEDPEADIHYASSDDRGRTFGRVKTINPGRAHADGPKLARARDGTLHLAWMESREGPLRAYRVLHARSMSNQTGFEQAQAISEPLPEGFADARFPHLALDGAGNPYVLIELFRSSARRGQGLALVRSGDGGKTFSAPALVPRGDDAGDGVNGSRQGLLMDKLAVSPEGEVFVVNSVFQKGEFSQVWLLRSR